MYKGEYKPSIYFILLKLMLLYIFNLDYNQEEETQREHPPITILWAALYRVT